MKATPTDKKITARMQPGVITYSGFLGKDTRNFKQIIADDEMVLEKLGKSAEEIADRLEYFQQKSFDAFQGSTVVDEIYDVNTEVVRGYLPCPFMHQGVYRKSYTTVTNTKSGKSFTYSALNIHLIRVHHFFEGKKSHFRLEPRELVAELF
ncbi:MAG: hypothetical protein RBR69_07870 [Candidatus Cloacimonadaceae bacterium]|jgi:hypothetical protein|nr:hypothetical protein [Candidatus Cloacimonadota bacterium]MDY0128032.1 hypothetical protein [Candidatus Cloacimonadaceae bacterium]MCB5254542.1 hypothetical protein [Candidatus Cloacimonadota bacterium]MCK9178796.1 hypothetical protein [Candidatus Cloacimonadota bacterium]MDD3102643.1 hypothetical protein [Candidatus Cloacimonadota bacterium]